MLYMLCHADDYELKKIKITFLKKFTNVVFKCTLGHWTYIKCIKILS